MGRHSKHRHGKTYVIVWVDIVSIGVVTRIMKYKYVDVLTIKASSNVGHILEFTHLQIAILFHPQEVEYMNLHGRNGPEKQECSQF